MNKKLILIPIVIMLSSCSNINKECGSGTLSTNSCSFGLKCQYDDGCIDKKGEVYVDMDGYWSGKCVKNIKYPQCLNK